MNLVMNDEHLRYPVGRFVPPAGLDPADITAWIATIEQLPELVEKEYARIGDKNLDLHYRPGGWTARQVFHHIVDSHVNSYIRFKLALTEDNPVIKPYYEERWAMLPDSTGFPVKGSIDLLRTLHARWVYVLKSITPEQYSRKLFHPQSGKTMDLNELLALYAWHSNHHLAHLRLITGSGS
jgi:hypothetical protein